jgi:hypothetical protein
MIIHARLRLDASVTSFEKLRAGKSARRAARTAARYPFHALAADPRTRVDAAAALAAAGEGPDWWPYALLVGPRDIAVYLASGRPPEPPEEPWRVGHDPQLWIIDRDALDPSPDVNARLVLLGYLDDGLVLIDTRHLYGPLVVGGTGEAAERVRGLLRAQPSGADVLIPDDDPDGAHWRIEVDSAGVIMVNGKYMALALPPRAPELPAFWTSWSDTRGLAGTGVAEFAAPSFVMNGQAEGSVSAGDPADPLPARPASGAAGDTGDLSASTADASSAVDVGSWTAVAVSTAAAASQAADPDEDL